MSIDSFDLSSTERTRFDDGDYIYELHNQNGKLIIDIRSNNSRIRKAKPINITVPDTIDYSINLHQCFYDHRYLDDISALGSFDTRHVTDMSEMFYDCRKLKDCNALSSWDVSKVMNMSDMFYCTTYRNEDLRQLSNWNVHEHCVLSGFRSQGIGFYQRGTNSPIINSIFWNHRNLYPDEAARIRDTSPQWLLDRDAAQRNRRT